MFLRLSLILFICLSGLLAANAQNHEDVDEIDILFRSSDTESNISRLFALDVDNPQLDPFPIAEFDEETELLDYDVSPDGSWLALLTLRDDSVWFSRQELFVNPNLEIDMACSDTYVAVHILGDNQTAGVNTCADFTLINTTREQSERPSQYDGISVRDWVSNNHHLDISRGGTAHVCYQAPQKLIDTTSDCQEITSENPLFNHLFSLGFTADGQRVAYLGLLSPDENQEIYLPVGIAEAEDGYIAEEGRIYDVWGAPENMGQAGVVWHPDGVRFIYQFQAPLSADETYGLVLYNTKTGASDLLISGLAFEITSGKWSLDGERLGLLVATDVEQQIGGILWLYDMITSEFQETDIVMQEMDWLN